MKRVAWWLLAVGLAGFATLRPTHGQSIDSPMTVGDLLAFVVVLGLLVGVARLTARIAARKGGSYIAWAYYGLLLPYIALPHALLKNWPHDK